MAKRRKGSNLCKADQARAKRRAAARAKREAADAIEKTPPVKRSPPPVKETPPKLKAFRPAGDDWDDSEDLDQAEKHRRKAAQRSRANYAKAGELGEIPDVVDPERRARCEFDAWLFIHDYMIVEGMAELGELHEKIVANMQASILEGDVFAQAIARGFAKTTIAIWLIVWAALYGHRKYLVLFGYDKPGAEDLLGDVMSELMENDKLAEDFPEIIHAIREIDGNNQRARNQTFRGEKTHARWQNDCLVLPCCKGADGVEPAGAFCVIRARSQGNARGLRYRLPNGKRTRPDYFLADDVENDDSAASEKMIEKLIKRIFKAWLPMSGHFRAMAGVINGTIAERGCMIDQATDPENTRFALFQKVRFPMVLKWADGHDKLWLGKYRDLLLTYTAGDVKGKAEARKQADAYYLANQEEMDRGCVVSWEGAKEAGEISAIQHAYNLLIKLGDEAFATECQQSPLKSAAEELLLPASVIVAKQHGCPPTIVPADATHVVAMVDQQDSLLYWVVAAFADWLTGYIIDFGAWPDQQRSYWTLASAPMPLGKYYQASARPEHGGKGVPLEPNAAITAGLTDLSHHLFTRDYKIMGGGVKKLSRMGVDAANGKRTEIIRNWMAHSPYRSQLVGTQGRGIRAKDRPMADWPKQQGERRGLEWIERRTKEGLPHLMYNTNYWKKSFFQALALAHGSVGCYSLPKAPQAALQIFGDHCQPMTCQWIETPGGSAHEFEDNPGAENHLFDCGVGVRVVALSAGVLSPGQLRAPRRTKRTTRKSRSLG